MGWVILAASVICVWWLVAHGWPWVEDRLTRFAEWRREGREIDRTVAAEAAELNDDEIDRWLRGERP